MGTFGVTEKNIWTSETEEQESREYLVIRSFMTCSESSNVITIFKPRRVKWADHAARMEMRNALKIVVGKLQGNRHFGSPSRGWKDIIKIDFKEKEVRVWTEFNWLNVRLCRALVNTVINLRTPQKARNFLTKCVTTTSRLRLCYIYVCVCVCLKRAKT
jgi:hypothetical protein